MKADSPYMLKGFFDGSFENFYLMLPRISIFVTLKIRREKY